jgi:hypothetical protein
MGIGHIFKIDECGTNIDMTCLLQQIFKFQVNLS